MQPRPEGLAQAFIIGREFIGESIGGARARRQYLLRPWPLRCAAGGGARTTGATVFAYTVKDPERYGVVEFDADGQRPRHRREARQHRDRNGR